MKLDDAIRAFVHHQSETTLNKLHTAFLAAEIHVPVAEAAKELQKGRHQVTVICIRTEAGTGAIPAFSTVEHLLKWKPRGCLYAAITGRALIAMARDMDGIEEIQVNPGSAPRGRIPRSAFEPLLAEKCEGGRIGFVNKDTPLKKPSDL